MNFASDSFVIEFLRKHPSALIGKLPDHTTLPTFDSPISLEISEKNNKQLSEFGIKAEGLFGEGNKIVIEAGANFRSIAIAAGKLKPANNVIFIPSSSRAGLQISFSGNNHLVCIAASGAVVRINATFRGSGSALIWGANTKSRGV